MPPCGRSNSKAGRHKRFLGKMKGPESRSDSGPECFHPFRAFGQNATIWTRKTAEKSMPPIAKWDQNSFNSGLKPRLTAQRHETVRASESARLTRKNTWFFMALVNYTILVPVKSSILYPRLKPGNGIFNGLTPPSCI